MRPLQCCEDDYDHDGNCPRHQSGVVAHTSFADLRLTGRIGGKTTNLLKWMREAPDDEIRIYVAHSREEQHRVFRSTINEDCSPSGFESWQFVSWDEIFGPGVWSGVLYGHPGKRIVLGIDNLDIILSRIIPWEVGVATMSTLPAEIPVPA